MTVAALVLGAGRGERLGSTAPKAFVRLHGHTLLERSIAAMEQCREVETIVPVVPRGLEERFRALGLPFRKLREPVAGGDERQDSVAAGLSAVEPGTGLVAVHDAARCLVSPADVARVIARARECGAAVLAEPVRDTIKRVVGGRVVETPPRAECWAAQTPQVFALELLREALAKARADGVVGTDDASLVERLGVPVHVVAAGAPNPKITTPADLEWAEHHLASGRGDA